MKKLYRKGTVHPTPSVVSDHLLSFLPAAILTLTIALSPEDKEVLAYVISCSSANFSNSHRKTSQKTAAAGSSKSGDDHPPCFSCNCFRCYTSYWVKWDSSPNHQLIHEIIDAFEESLSKESKKEKNKKERRKGKTVKLNISLVSEEPKRPESKTNEVFNFPESNAAADSGGDTCGGGGGEGGSGSGVDEEEEEDNVEVEESEKGSVRRFVSFLGERIWSVWG